MKKYALLCVLMSIMSSAYAFEWVKIGEKEEYTMFVDRISLVNAKQQMTSNKIYWEKYIIPSEMQVAHLKRELDCKNYKHRVAEMRVYNMSETELSFVVKEASKWHSSNKDDFVLFSELCKK